MGLTANSTGKAAIDTAFSVKKQSDSDKVIAFAGNPNVGKSTLFNALTGLNQHTGNWPGKTVASAQGYCKTEKNNLVLVDIPGTYSLMAHSAEEEIARDFICFGKADAIVIVCDATCLLRNMNLVLQTLEITENVLICVNLIDEAKRKKIKIDIDLLSKRLSVPVIGTVGRNKKSIKALTDAIDKLLESKPKPFRVRYNNAIENAISIIEPKVHNSMVSARWLALRLLDSDFVATDEVKGALGEEFFQNEEITTAVNIAKESLVESGIDDEALKNEIVKNLVLNGENLCTDVITYERTEYDSGDRKADKLLTGKAFGIPAMILLLCLIFFITITGANYPSAWLSALFEEIGVYLSKALIFIKTPPILQSLIMDGIYRVLTWVIAVMLPPMAIFFPLFTFLEDVGYLPRIAYNLDLPFKKCRACGKQALTMCMGFGCNAAGVVGCRIIDSPRERMLAILTNSFVPCNGRFPALISIITMFFVGFSSSVTTSALSTLLLTTVIVFSVAMTLMATKFLSDTILKGAPSSFTLELPPYRKPQIGKIIVRSVFDRTLFVLGRAAAVAAPAGMIIWLFANVKYGGSSILSICADFLDPFARLMGLDGIILIAFILGFPANEIVIPLIIMAYTSQGVLTDSTDLLHLKTLLESNGWTWVTAVCVMVFILMHWPCSTTLMTIKKETGSIKWTALAALFPTLIGMVLCMLINFAAKLII